MTNKEWLDYLAHNAPDELSAWFDAEHVETEERALDGDTAPENEDSRERLEADVRNFAEKSGWLYPMAGTRIVLEWLDRQAAITERECIGDAGKASMMGVVANERECYGKRIAELTAERDKLQELDEYHALQYELASEDCDRLQAQVDELFKENDALVEERPNLQKQLRFTSAEREHYRSMCSNMATKIHDALMVMDEGMA